MPLFVGAQMLQAPVDFWMLLPRAARIAASIVSAVLLGGLLRVFWSLLRRDALARFWALGMALSLVPFCTMFPQVRLLVFAGIGGCGLLAMLFENAGVWPRKPAAGGGRRGAAWLLLLVHGPVAAALVPHSVAALPLLGALTSAPSRQAPVGPEVARQTFVFLNGSDFLLAYLQLLRTARGVAPVPRRMALLSSLATASRVERFDDRTLVIATPAGWFHYAFDAAFVSPRRKFSAGERIDRPDYVAEIRSTTGDGRPLEVAFRFRRTLESPELRWLYWSEGRLVPFPLPAVGASVSVPRGL